MDFCSLGLYLHESGLLGASPDGVAENYTVEIKCPYTYRDSDDLCISYKLPVQKSQRSLFNYDENEKRWILNKDHDYFHQIQAQIYFTHKKFSYYFVWTTKTFKLFRIEKDPNWELHIERLIDFYVNQFVPFIFENPTLLQVVKSASPE